ncbi:MAG TPA: redoxin family protein [Terriglobales bacterium]|nr:redoxin family protein [Terriglobales bacterium]
MKILPVLVLAITSVSSLSQTPPPSVALDGLDLLKRVSQHYADAKSYRIDAEEERDSHNELQRSWQKTILSATKAPDGKFRYEGRSGFGSAFSVSDGKQVWEYHVDSHVYTVTPVGPRDPNQPHIFTQDEFALDRSQRLRDELAGLAKHYKSARRLPDVELDHRICYVVRVTNQDAKRNQPDYSFEDTIWIDKGSETVVKRIDHTHSFMLTPGGRIPLEEETTTTYLTELDRPIPDSRFSFTPPAGARLLDRSPDPFEMGPTLEGQVVPSLNLTPADGKTISTDALRGKPIILDFWATWCAPCVENLEKLAQVYQQTKDKGLVLVTIDQDEDAETARSFLRKKGYDWPNVHDDGRNTQAVGESDGIPRTILVDRNGKVVYDKTAGNEEGKLRAAIAKLGPEFASLVTKPSVPPCGTPIAAVPGQ